MADLGRRGRGMHGSGPGFPSSQVRVAVHHHQQQQQQQQQDQALLVQSMVPAGAPSGARHHNQHHPIFGQPGSPPGGGGIRPSSSSSPSPTPGPHHGPHVTEYKASGRPIPGAGVHAIYGAAAEQGKRPTMEDTHGAHLNVCGPDTGTALFLVCDGHSGRHVADMAARLLPECIAEADPRTVAANAPKLLTDAFVHTDRTIYRKVNGRDGGAACVAALLVRKELFVANLGDSRAVLCDSGRAVALTRDHKSTDPSEAQRVELAGGFLAFGRVGGCLAITRAFGDFELKGGERVLTEGAPLPVSNVPEISKITLTASSEFLILACDGVWDVLSGQDAVTVCRDCAVASAGGHGLASKMAAHLAKTAVQKGSMDNVTVMIVLFQDGIPPHQQVEVARPNGGVNHGIIIARGGGGSAGRNFAPVPVRTTVTATATVGNGTAGHHPHSPGHHHQHQHHHHHHHHQHHHHHLHTLQHRQQGSNSPQQQQLQQQQQQQQHRPHHQQLSPQQQQQQRMRRPF